MTDYDSPWKNALKRYFPDFLAFFFPAAHAGIDWTKAYTMLDKELQKAVRDATLGRRWADSLVRVTARDGKEDWILAHVEIQGQNQPDFPKRMFVYNYRIYDVHVWTEIQNFEEEKRMHYLASFERVAQKKGIAQGIKRGIGQGQARLLTRLLEERFGPMPEPQATRVQSATPEQLETWALRLLDAASLDDVFGRDGQH